jgi:hypothetical protein
MRMHQIVFVKNNTVYVILLQAPDEEFDSEKTRIRYGTKQF